MHGTMNVKKNVWRILMVFLAVYRNVAGYKLKSGKKSFSSHTFHFTCTVIPIIQGHIL